MPRIVLALLAIVSCLAGCAAPRQTDVSQHPEISAEHLRIMASGKLANGDQVAGMTRQQIRQTMRMPPVQITSINATDVWMWVKRKGDSLSGEDPAKQVNIRTTVFFNGDLATKVNVTEEPVRVYY